jgi:hypothetical protein
MLVYKISMEPPRGLSTARDKTAQGITTMEVNFRDYYLKDLGIGIMQ